MMDTSGSECMGEGRGSLMDTSGTNAWGKVEEVMMDTSGSECMGEGRGSLDGYKRE